MSTINVKELASELRQSIEDLRVSGDLASTGVVTRVGDGVAWIYGLKNYLVASSTHSVSRSMAKDRSRPRQLVWLSDQQLV